MTLRTDRVGEVVREVLAEEIVRLTDPGLGFLTITGVDVTPDLAHALVFFSVFDSEERDATARALARARPRLQARLGASLRLKRTPELRFAPDVGIEAGERIDAILRDLSREGRGRPVGDADRPADESGGGEE